MKKYIKYMAATLLAVNFTACSGFLDKEVDLTLGAEDVFDKAENTRGLLANIYTYIPIYQMHLLAIQTDNIVELHATV